MRMVFSSLKMGWSPVQLTSHNCYGATNKTNEIIPMKRCKDPLERWLIPRWRQGKFTVRRDYPIMSESKEMHRN